LRPRKDREVEDGRIIIGKEEDEEDSDNDCC
jgi:hypothetical protein